MPSNVSGAPATVSFRCSSCGEYTVIALDWSLDRHNLPCEACGGFVDLRSHENRDVIMRAIQRRQPDRNS